MLTASQQAQVDQAFALCKMQASTDEAFPDELLRHWFEAAWNLCAEMVGLVFPARAVVEPICLDRCGNFTLSDQPSGDVRIYDGYTLIMILPPSLQRNRCQPSLCCYCNLSAHYTVGNDDPCDAIPPRFIQAVARLFTYMVENRGDTELNDQILGKCGALCFLSPDLDYVA